MYTEVSLSDIMLAHHHFDETHRLSFRKYMFNFLVLFVYTTDECSTLGCTLSMTIFFEPLDTLVKRRVILIICLGKSSKKNPLNLWACSYLPRTPPPPPTVSALGYFFSQRFLDYLGCLVDFVKFWVTFHQNNAKEGWSKFHILMARGLMLMVK